MEALKVNEPLPSFSFSQEERKRTANKSDMNMKVLFMMILDVVQTMI